MAGKHTPGPWSIGNDDADCGVPFIQIETDTQAICEVSSMLLDEDVDFQITAETRANAALIAAAPDLLVACCEFTAAAHAARDAFNAAGLACPASIALAAERARHAIAKAEGIA